MSFFKKITYVYGLSKSRAAEGHAPVSRQIFEMIWLRLTTGINYNVYHYARMWRRDVDWHYKTGFTSATEYRKLVSRLNRGKYHGVSQYKPFEKAYFRQFNLPTPKYLGTFHGRHGQTAGGAGLSSLEQFEQFMLAFAGERVCFKPVVGYGGSGFQAYEVTLQEDKVVFRSLSDNSIIAIEDLYRSLLADNPEGWLIEEYMLQHPVMARLNASSVNTIRMYIYETKSGEPLILGTRIRIGRNGSLVDNVEAGGIGGNVNPETGIVEFAHESSTAMTEITHHPDSGVELKGFQIPMWQEIRDIGIRALAHMPETRFLGLDIALTEKGPVMIEMNVQPSMGGLPRCEVPFRHIFEV